MSATFHPRLHRFAAATLVVTLATLVMGALVTSKNAGMAFRDWPTSDGQPMLTYPWLSDFARDWDKFLEHGHRLIAALTGMWCIGLVGLLGWYESRTWVKVLGGSVLLGVIAQGILGGNRVWFDDRGLALLHGLFAAIVFSAIACTATVLSRRWWTAAEQIRQAPGSVLLPAAAVTLGLLFVQYIFGGLIRHRGTGLHEHLALGILSLCAVCIHTVIAHRSRISWVRRSAWLLQILVLVQVALGGASWVTKWGFTPVGYVGIADSILQVGVRTGHMVVGALVIAAATVHLVRVSRCLYLADREKRPAATDAGAWQGNLSRGAILAGGGGS